MTAARSVDLLILDFGGVCTRSPSEMATTDDAGSIEESIRTKCIDVVSRAQAAGVVVAVLSNEIDSSWADSVPLLRQVDHIIACTDNGILKPDRRAYQRVLLATGIDAERSLFVDDSHDNVLGAQAAGMEAILFDTADPNGSWSKIGSRIL